MARLRKGIATIAAAIIVAGSPGFAEPVTIAALGDSLTHGFGLPQEQGFVPQMEAWLRERGHDVVMINAGVSGDTTAGGLSRVAWTLTDEVDAMIVALGGNDLLRGIDPAASRANLAGILEAARDKGVVVLIAGLEAPGNFGPDYKAAFDAIYPDLAKEFEALYAESFLAGMLAARDDGATTADLMQGDGIHPNAEGVRLNVAALGPLVEELIAEAKTGP